METFTKEAPPAQPKKIWFTTMPFLGREAPVCLPEWQNVVLCAPDCLENWLDARHAEHYEDMEDMEEASECVSKATEVARLKAVPLPVELTSAEPHVCEYCDAEWRLVDAHPAILISSDYRLDELSGWYNPGANWHRSPTWRREWDADGIEWQSGHPVAIEASVRRMAPDRFEASVIRMDCGDSATATCRTVESAMRLAYAVAMHWLDVSRETSGEKA